MNDLSRNFGCKLSMGLFVVLLSLFLSTSMFAQVDGAGGPIVTIQLVPVCDADSTVFAMMQSVIGSANPTLLKYVDAAGNDHTLSGGLLTAGYCTGDGNGSGPATPDYEYNILTMCDDGTPFYRLRVVVDDVVTIEDYALDLTTTYTTSGTVDVGPCYTVATAALTRTVAIGTGTVTAGAFSYTICNTGLSDGTVTINGGTSKLIPGSCTSYRGSINPVTRQLKVAPEVGYNATGTVFDIIVEN